LDVGSFRFSVRPAGRNVVRLEVAELAFGPDDGLLLKPGLRQREEVPAALFKGRRDVFTLTVGTAERIELPVGRALRGLEFLLSSGSKPRLTGLAVGRVELRFADGFVATHSLVYGREVDSSAFPFATAVAVRAMPHDPTVTLPWHVAAFALPVKERRVVEIVALAVTVMDTHLGLLALNLVVE
jgi:hypothetical protein